MATMYGVSAFYLGLVLFGTETFATLLVPPADGRGPLPLLQNHPLMAVHPPFLYLGFIGFTVPFAFAIASLIRGELSAEWIRLTRRWMLSAWIFLTIGLVLGAAWSYGVLGWGGYWAWDPVENVALLPWLMATAFLHSVMIEERRGMLQTWNLSLAVGTFALTTFGTFLTRGSILSSVHAFAQSAVGPMYLGFLVLVLVGGYGLIVIRSWRVSSRAQFGSALSREAAFLGNNWVLLALTFVVLLGTIFPLIVEALTSRQVTVGGPYFKQTTAPVFLLLLFLMGVGPLLRWRGDTAASLRHRMTTPALAGAGTVVGLAILGMVNVAALAALGLATFVAVTNARALITSVRASLRSSGGGTIRSIPSAIARNRRLNGGLIVHLGVVIVAVAITTSSSFQRQVEVTVSSGQEISFAGYQLRYEGLEPIRQPQRMVLVARIAVRNGDHELGMLIPSLNLYPSASEPIGTPSVRYGVLRDLYSSVIGFEGNGERATLRFFLNPGVMWLWVGGTIVALGGVLAAWPARRQVTYRTSGHRRRELAKVT
jgi:cytochrome c-type biogenesis protein CcmF